MKIARFRRVGVDAHCVYETIKDEKDAKYIGEDFVQISDYIEVEFPPLTDESIVEQHLGVLDKAEASLRNKFQAALNGIEQQRQELRAITFRA